MSKQLVKHLKPLIVIILLSLTIFLSFTMPKAKHISTNFVSTLDIPKTMQEWNGKDVTKRLYIDYDNTEFYFIGKALAHEYVNKAGDNLVLIVLDAGNFHYPNVCFISSGFQVRDLNDVVFNLPGHKVRSHALLSKRGNEHYLVIYWIVIDKKVVHEWVEQKIKQLFFSLFNKKRVGLMVRLDIPVKNDNIDAAHILAKKFINSLNQELALDQVDYIFGKSNE